MPSSRSFFAVLAALVAAAFAFFLAPPAQAAESMTFSNPTTTPPGNPTSRSAGPGAVAGVGLGKHDVLPWGVGFQDCEADVVMSFSLNVVFDNATADKIQVWAGLGGADCTQLTPSRTQGTNNCWPVTNLYDRAVTTIIPVRGRDLAAVIPKVPSSLTTVTYTPAGEEACHAQELQNITTPAPLTLYFMFLNGAQSGENPAALTYVINVDTLGPPPPTVSGNSVGIGDKILYPSWTPTSNTNVIGYRVFCSPPPGKSPNSLPPIDASCTTTQSIVPRLFPRPLAPGDDAGADADADPGVADTGVVDTGVVDTGIADTGSTKTCTSTEAGTAACAASPFPNGVGGGSIPSDYVCAEVSSITASSYTQTGLVNDTNYYFAIASVDKLGNAGAVVNLGCNFPGAISDFWTQYKNAGGQAGGCSVQTPSGGFEEPVGLAMFGMIFVGAAGAVVRRWRRR